MSTQNVNVARFARNVEWEFFLWFSNTVQSTKIVLKSWKLDFFWSDFSWLHFFFLFQTLECFCNSDLCNGSDNKIAISFSLWISIFILCLMWILKYIYKSVFSSILKCIKWDLLLQLWQISNWWRWWFLLLSWFQYYKCLNHIDSTEKRGIINKSTEIKEPIEP